MPRKSHVHKYYLLRTAQMTVWACGDPDGCSHYMPEHLKELVPGRASVCWKCGKRFKLTVALMELTQPLCPECREGSAK